MITNQKCLISNDAGDKVIEGNNHEPTNEKHSVKELNITYFKINWFGTFERQLGSMLIVKKY